MSNVRITRSGYLCARRVANVRQESSRGWIESREPIHSAKWGARRHCLLSLLLGPDMLMKGEPANMR